MATKRFLAFDLGAESGRAVLGTLDKGHLTLEEKHRFPNNLTQLNGHLHWNLPSLWDNLKTGLRKAEAKLDGIGIDTWGVDFGFIAKNGEILGLPYGYRDSRTDGMLKKAFRAVGKEAIYNATGIQFMQLNTLYQLLAMRLNKSPILDMAQTMLFMPDLFNYLFTGQRKSEVSIASTSQMLNPRNMTWAKSLLNELDIPTHFLPKIVPSGSIIGNLTDEVAAECGVAPMPVIAPGCHDTASAVAAVPADGDNWAYISSGTWSLMGVELDKPIITPQALKLSYTNEVGVGGKIRFLKNIMGLWLVQECRRQWQKEGTEYTYPQLTTMAFQAKPFAALVNPDHDPFLKPFDMPKKIEQFCKQTKQKAPATPGEFVRTCLESLALTYRRTIEGLDQILGRRIEVIHIVGGGSNNELLNQMTANACGRPVIAGPSEGTAVGNLLVQAIAVGAVKSLAEARKIVRASFPVKCYEPKDTASWDTAYDRFRAILAK